MADYFAASERLRRHWKQVLGDRILELEYEDLVSAQNSQTRALLDHLGLPFEQTCLEFEKIVAASNTASTVQIREKIHTRSVDRSNRFEHRLQPLRKRLEGNEVAIN